MNLLFENPVDSAAVLLPQCADLDEDFLREPYCQGIYVISSGQVHIVHEGNSCFTLKNGDSFGESVFLKQPVRIFLII